MYPKADYDHVGDAYQRARERYRAFGVDTDEVIRRLNTISVSMNCWQADDVAGFEGQSGITGGGILATGNYPGRARTPGELRADALFAFSLVPGPRRLNLHASYLESGGKAVERDEVTTEHFTGWLAWARKNKVALDFNPTFFSHDKANDGFTLSHPDAGIRNFWIRHGIASRRIAADFGRELGDVCMNNFWIPDGMKDNPADRLKYRRILVDALDEIFAADVAGSNSAASGGAPYSLDAVESKLFGIGSEAYVVGSHEFYLAYAISRKKTLCIDAGHFHPTEHIGDKISAILCFLDSLLLHVSRPMRWDSDHVVVLDDETTYIAREIARADAFDRVRVAVDFFDASINRIAAWAVGMRATRKAILMALLEPTSLLREAENSGRYGERLALSEEFKMLPVADVWAHYCVEAGAPIGTEWIDQVRSYEKDTLSKRKQVEEYPV